MCLKSLPLDITLYIWGFVETNKESVSLLQTCKEMSKIGKDFGYLKKIHVRYDTDMMEYINRCFTHKLSLNYIKLDNVDDPYNWIPIKWPKTIVFARCNFSDKEIIAPKGTVTEKIVITSAIIYDSNAINIKWSSLTQLKHLEVCNHNINLVGIENTPTFKTSKLKIRISYK